MYEERFGEGKLKKQLWNIRVLQNSMINLGRLLMKKELNNYNSEFNCKFSDKGIAEVVAFLYSKEGGCSYIRIVWYCNWKWRWEILYKNNITSGSEKPYYIKQYGQSEKGCLFG